MKRALINPSRCTNCGTCRVESECTMTAVFRESPEDRPWVDFYRCNGCMECKAWCPDHAIDEIAHPCSGGGRMGW